MLQDLTHSPAPSPDDARHYAVVASRYNAALVEPMVEAALAELSRLEPASRTEVFRAPGSFEIPFLASRIARDLKPDAILCLGVILRGETGHADLIASSVSDELCRLSVEAGLPVIHGVLLLKDQAQAEARCLPGNSNRGTEAARAAVLLLRETTTLPTP
jgi:6,7-dimethyl-8-ribityllumazine synthase